MFVPSYVRFFLTSVLFVLLISPSDCLCQDITPVFENISDGLPSSEVHDVFQDSIGYMWFATDRGICRYDGGNFKLIEHSLLLKSNVIFKFFKQHESRIWILTGDGRLYSFNPFDASPKFTAFEKNQELLSLENYSSFSRNVSRMHFEPNGVFLYSKKSTGYISLSGNKMVHEFRDESTSSSSFDIEIKKANNHFYSITKQTPNKQENHLYFQNLKVPLSPDYWANFIPNVGISSTLETGNTTLISVGNILICSKNGESSFLKLPSRILSLVSTEGEKFFIGTYNGVFEINDKLEILNHFLKEEVIAKLYKSESDMLWIATIQNGLYLCTDRRFNEVLLSNGRNSTRILKTRSYLGLYSNLLKNVVYLNPDMEATQVYEEVYLNHFSIKSRSKSSLHEYIGAPRQYTSPSRDHCNQKFLLPEYDDANYVFSMSKLYRRENQKLIQFQEFKDNLLVKFSCDIHKPYIILGTKEGLLRYHPSTKTYESYYPKLTKGIGFNTYTVLPNATLFASRKGVFCLKDEQLSLLSGSHDFNIQGFSTNKKGDIFAHSDKHVFRISLENGKWKFLKIELPIARANLFILSIETFNHQLWIATKKGLFNTDLNKEQKKRKERFYVFHIDSMFAGSRKINVNSDIRIMPEDNFELYFNIITFDRNNSRKLEYSLDSDRWFEMNKNSLSIANLPSGSYTLKIRSIESPNRILFTRNFVVLKHFYQEVWFLTLCLFSLAVIVYFVVKKVIQIKQKKTKEELEKLNLELKLLTSKMNPHFTFNTINSIQHSIMKSDKKSSIQYLSEFALLMRKNLDFSMEERIFLKDEKEFIELYVKMENKRFDANFILKFETEEASFLRTKKIPSMLIQPLVENIILHADYKEGEEKIIHVKISCKQDFYLIQVIDFGVGKMTEKESLNKHKSYGLEILRSRVKIYNGTDFKDSDVQISYSLPNEKKGTTVTVKLKEWKQ